MKRLPILTILSRAAIIGHGRRAAQRPGRGSDSVRVGSCQPVPRGTIGRALQLQRSRPLPALDTATAAQHQPAGAAAGRPCGRSSADNPRHRSRIVHDSSAGTHPLRAVNARRHPAPMADVGPVGDGKTSGTGPRVHAAVGPWPSASFLANEPRIQLRQSPPSGGLGRAVQLRASSRDLHAQDTLGQARHHVPGARPLGSVVAVGARRLNLSYSKEASEAEGEAEARFPSHAAGPRGVPPSDSPLVGASSRVVAAVAAQGAMRPEPLRSPALANASALPRAASAVLVGALASMASPLVAMPDPENKVPRARGVAHPGGAVPRARAPPPADPPGLPGCIPPSSFWRVLVDDRGRRSATVRAGGAWRWNGAGGSSVLNRGHHASEPDNDGGRDDQEQQHRGDGVVGGVQGLRAAAAGKVGLRGVRAVDAAGDTAANAFSSRGSRISGSIPARVRSSRS